MLPSASSAGATVSNAQKSVKMGERKHQADNELHEYGNPAAAYEITTSPAKPVSSSAVAVITRCPMDPLAV
jgi:hypothetical protein